MTANSELIGRVMACPHCANHFTIPQDGAEAVPIATPDYNYPAPGAAIRFTFSCQRCSSILEARGDLGGKQGRCPTCGAVFVVPRVDPRTGLPLSSAAVEDDGQLPTPMHAYATAGSKAPTIRRLPTGEQVIHCPRCRRDMPVDSNTCTACGMPFTMEGAAAVTYTNSGSNGLATASLTVGIIAMVAACIPGLGLVAIGLGYGGLKRAEKMGADAPGRSMAIAGIVLGALSLGWIALYLLGAF
ncbi:MAG: DUF4190 domain-containing protein [Phycisphaerales bacterium]|nr:DUF4190 domain-containing protein [Phycisphaerales bacterium]